MKLRHTHPASRTKPALIASGCGTRVVEDLGDGPSLADLSLARIAGARKTVRSPGRVPVAPPRQVVGDRLDHCGDRV